MALGPLKQCPVLKCMPNGRTCIKGNMVLQSSCHAGSKEESDPLKIYYREGSLVFTKGRFHDSNLWPFSQTVATPTIAPRLPFKWWDMYAFQISLLETFFLFWKKATKFQVFEGFSLQRTNNENTATPIFTSASLFDGLCFSWWSFILNNLLFVGLNSLDQS